MKTLIVEDGFVGRRLLVSILSAYGSCDTAVNGLEALEAFELAWSEGAPYDLICLDIMLPEMDGHEVLKRIRSFEAAKGISGLNCVKVIMTTSLSDFENIRTAFVEQCEGYLVKPISKAKLIETLKKLELVQSEE